YFVAKYFQENLSSQINVDTLKSQLHDIAEKVYYEEYANILVFYLYLTKDREIIELMLNNTKQIYNEFKPCNFDENVKFINGIYNGPEKLSLPESGHEEHRDEYIQKLDHLEDESSLDENKEQKHIRYSKDLDDLYKINIAFKTMQINGQILRNFPGSLRKEIK